jgi:hypothetical protein
MPLKPKRNNMILKKKQKSTNENQFTFAFVSLLLATDWKINFSFFFVSFLLFLADSMAAAAPPPPPPPPPPDDGAKLKDTIKADIKQNEPKLQKWLITVVDTGEVTQHHLVSDSYESLLRHLLKNYNRNSLLSYPMEQAVDQLCFLTCDDNKYGVILPLCLKPFDNDDYIDMDWQQFSDSEISEIWKTVELFAKVLQQSWGHWHDSYRFYFTIKSYEEPIFIHVKK